MKYLLTALAVTVAALALAVGAFGASGEIAQIKHATLHLEQTGMKPFMLERADIPRIKHTTLHLEQTGMKPFMLERAGIPRIKHATLHLEQAGMKFWVGS